MEIRPQTPKCLMFLKSNSLYLTATARNAFLKAANLLSDCYIANREKEFSILSNHLKELEEQGAIIRDALSFPDISVWKEE